MTQQMEDVKALQQFAIYAEIESWPTEDEYVSFCWETYTDGDLTVRYWACEIRDETSVIARIDEDDFTVLHSLHVSESNSRAEFLEQTLSLCAANGLEPSGYWNCERSDFWRAAPVM